MTLTMIDTVPALIVVDFQNGVRSNPTAHPLKEVVGNAAALAAAFRRLGHPVVLASYVGGPSGRSDAGRARQVSGAPTQLPPENWSQLLPELDAQPSDLTISKTGWGAFQGTGLKATLDGLGVTQVILAGVATSLGVESTAREARDLGYNVVVAVDAITDLNPAAHDHSVATIFPLLGEVATTAEILGLVDEEGSKRPEA